MRCPECNRWNETNAKFCNYCGYNLEEDIPYHMDRNEQSQGKDKEHKKGKTKKKNVTKTKKVKEKNKDKKQKEKRNKNDVVVVKKMSFVQKFMVFLLFLLFLAALGIAGFLGYHIYDTEVTEVPHVVGLTLEEATKVMDEKELRISTKEVTVDNKNEDGIVLSQSKDAGTEISKFKKIKLTIGVYKETLTMPDFMGLHIESVQTFLNKKGIPYHIKYKTSDTSDEMVIAQSIKPDTKVDTTKTITLTVTKKKEQTEIREEQKEDIPESSDSSDSTTSEESNPS